MVKAAEQEHLSAQPRGPAADLTAALPRRFTLFGATRETLLLASSGALLAAAWLAGWLRPDRPLAAVSLYALTILVGGFPTARKGIRSLLRLEFDINTLMAVSVAGAALIGEWSEGAVVAFLFNLSEALESYSMERARGAIRALVQLAPRQARVRRGQVEAEVPVEQVQVGDRLLVRPGERIAMDGVVRQGSSSVNQAAITGESIPAEKEPGSQVFAGSLNGEGALEIEVTRRVDDTTLARIIHLVEEAQAQRAPAQRFVDLFARYYTPAVMALATLIMTVPPLLLGQPWRHWLYQGLALLVVSCPCALVVSTPVALVSAIANAARNGVLIKGGLHLEQAGRIQAVAFDKTGTLTRGRPVVTDVIKLEGAMAEILCLAGAVEQHSEHPLARAIVAAARHECLSLPAAEGFRSITGKGASAVVGGTRYYVGSPRLLAEVGADTGPAAAAVERLQAAGKTVMLLGTADRVLGIFGVADQLRASSVAALRALAHAGVKQTVMLTGDNAGTAAAVAAQAGISDYRAGLLPEEKVAAIRELRERHGTVAMVGDGVNDAPALAAASLGIAMGGAGTDVALETADVALMADDLSKLPFLIRLSRATLKVIKQNIGLSLALKLAAVLAVFPGWLTLWLAILADMGATILVTLNGIRLLRMRP